MKKLASRSSLIVIALICCTAFVSAQAQQHEPTSPKAFANIKIDNFGQMDDHYYRGAQPEPDDYKALADLGVKTIVDLRNDPTDYEKADAEAVGIKYINLPMSGWRTPHDADIDRFLQIANDPATGTMYVHCKAGIHRTGITAAIYRFTKYGWNYDQAYQEMLNYNFYSGFVHGALKSYVKSYARKLEGQKAVIAQAAAPGPGVSK